jgi:murein DD-endopeptidase MepM/ murein hydrolase activator NlpD
LVMVALVLLGALGGVSLVAPPDGPLGMATAQALQVNDLEAQRQDIHARSRALRRKRDENLRRAQQMNYSIVRNQMALEASQMTLGHYQRRLNETQDTLGILSSSIDKTLGDTIRLSHYAGKRLREMYTGEPLSLLEMLLETQDVALLMDRIYYRQRIVAQDRKLLTELKVKTEILRRQKSQMAQQKKQYDTLVVQIHGQTQRISQQIQVDSVLRDKYKRDARFYEQAERELLAESDRIRRQIMALIRASQQQGGPVRASTGRFMWPIRGPITSGYGYRHHPIHRKRLMHTGLDIAGPNGGAVRAADGGRVIYAGWRGGYGKAIIINHGNYQGQNITTLYGHLSAIYVGQGQEVSRGQSIGAEGSTGYSTGPHLHFEVRINGGTVDPRGYL